MKMPVTVTLVIPWDKALEIRRAADIREISPKEFMLRSIYKSAREITDSGMTIRSVLMGMNCFMRM